jgi:hypothetical protein
VSIRALRGNNRFRADPAPPRLDSPARVLRRQRRLPLPRAVVRGAPVRAGRAARSRVAADRYRGGGVRDLAAALAAARRTRSQRLAAHRRAGGGVRGDERMLLRGDRPLAAGDGGGGRVPRTRRARPARRPDCPQPRRGCCSGGRRLPAHAGAARRGAGRSSVRVRERRALHGVHRPRPPALAPRRAGRRGRFGCGHADRVRLDLPGRAGSRGPGGRGSDCARRRRRHRAVVVRDPVRVRPARDGQVAARDLRAVRRAAAGDGDCDRGRRPASAAECGRPRRHRARHARRRAAPIGSDRQRRPNLRGSLGRQRPRPRGREGTRPPAVG